MEVSGAAASSSWGSRSTSVASSRASAFDRATWAAMPERPRAAMVAHVLRARKGLVCSSSISANVPTAASVSWRRYGAMRLNASRRSSPCCTSAQPASTGTPSHLWGSKNQRVEPLHAAVAARDRWVEHAERAVGAVDVEPEVLRWVATSASASSGSIWPALTVPAERNKQCRQRAGPRDRRQSTRAAQWRRAGLPPAAPLALLCCRGQAAPGHAARSYGSQSEHRQPAAGRRRGHHDGRHGRPPPARDFERPPSRRSSRPTRRWSAGRRPVRAGSPPARPASAPPHARGGRRRDRQRRRSGSSPLPLAKPSPRRGKAADLPSRKRPDDRCP